MSGKTISVWLNDKQAKRFEDAADQKRMTVSAFLKFSADQALIPTDHAQDFRVLTAELISEVRKELSRHSRTSTSMAHDEAERMREMFTGFLLQIEDEQQKHRADQIDIVKKTLRLATQAPRDREAKGDQGSIHVPTY